MDKSKPVSAAVVLSQTLRKDGETLGEFAAELKRLTPDEKQELAEAAAKHLGVDLVQNQPQA